MRIQNVRRAAAVTIGGAALLAGAGVAQAGGGNDYQGGPTTPGTDAYIGFDIGKFKGKRVVENIQYFGPTQCNPEEDEAAFGGSPGRIVLRANAFAGERKFESLAMGGIYQGTIAIDGKRTEKGVFRGTLQIKQVARDGDELEGRCNTGEVGYRVSSAPIR